MGAWETLVDYTVPSNTTSVVLDNFGEITKDDFIKVHTTIVNPTGSSPNIRIFPNEENNQNDYTYQRLTGGGSGVSANRTSSNAPRINRSEPNKTSSSFSYLKLSQSNHFNTFANFTNENTSDIVLDFNYGTSHNVTFPNGINKLTFSSSVSNGIGANSRIQIYRLAAEKVADITVTSNTTQVDITGLDIKKGDEYLLVGDNSFSATSSIDYAVNDNITRTNYYAQTILGSGSTTAASRTNNSFVNFAFSGEKGISYSHIKLSNIGAYTAQNYAIRRYGASDLVLQNTFVSSIAENITSITKINIVADVSNGIGSGSRYQLYKLYEGGN